MFFTSIHFHSRLKFAGKTGAYPNEPLTGLLALPEKIRQGCLSPIITAIGDVMFGDTHSCSPQYGINCGHKKFLYMSQWCVSITKTSFVPIIKHTSLKLLYFCGLWFVMFAKFSCWYITGPLVKGTASFWYCHWFWRVPRKRYHN